MNGLQMRMILDEMAIIKKALLVCVNQCSERTFTNLNDALIVLDPSADIIELNPDTDNGGGHGHTPDELPEYTEDEPGQTDGTGVDPDEDGKDEAQKQDDSPKLDGRNS